MVSTLVLVGTPFLLFTAPSSLPHTPNLYRTPSSTLFLPLLLFLSTILFNLPYYLPQFPPAVFGTTQPPSTIGYLDLSASLLTTNPTTPIGEEDTTHNNIKRNTLVFEPSTRLHDCLASAYEEVRFPPTKDGTALTPNINGKEESPFANLLPGDASSEGDTRLTTNLNTPTGVDENTTHNNINRSLPLIVGIPKFQARNDNTYMPQKSQCYSCLTTITGVDVTKECATNTESSILIQNRAQCLQKLRLWRILLTTIISPNGDDEHTKHNNINSNSKDKDNKSERHSRLSSNKSLVIAKECVMSTEYDILIQNRAQCLQKLRLIDILLTTLISPIGDDEYTKHNNINSISIYQVNRNDNRRN